MGAIRALVAFLNEDIIDDAASHVYYGFLPLAHSLEMAAELVFFSAGIRIGYGSPYTMTDNGTAIIPGQKGDLRLLRPTLMAGVPLILDRIRKTLTDRFERPGRAIFWKQLFKYFCAYKNFWIDHGYDTPLVNQFICKKVQGQLGGRVQFMIIGGAPLSPDTQRVMRAFLNVKLLIVSWLLIRVLILMRKCANLICYLHPPRDTARRKPAPAPSSPTSTTCRLA